MYTLGINAAFHDCSACLERTHADNLGLAGGVALNCVMNAAVRDLGRFKRVWVQPAAGDAGTALGAALWVDRGMRRARERRWHMDRAFLGPGYGDEEIEQFLRGARLPYRRLDDVPGEAAVLLAQDKIIGWFQGRMSSGRAPWERAPFSLRPFMPGCRRASTTSRTGRTSAPWRRWHWKRRPTSGSRAAACRRS